MFVLLFYFARSLHCLSVIDLRLVILPLASSNFSYYIDILLELNKERGLKTKLFDKRDEITFPIVNFPFISSNILSLHFTTRTHFWTELSCWCKCYQSKANLLLGWKHCCKNTTPLSRSCRPLRYINFWNRNGSFPFYVHFSLLYHRQDFLPGMTIRVTI
jgi:hypothetical protein